MAEVIGAVGLAESIVELSLELATLISVLADLRNRIDNAAPNDP